MKLGVLGGGAGRWRLVVAAALAALPGVPACAADVPAPVPVPAPLGASAPAAAAAAAATATTGVPGPRAPLSLPIPLPLQFSNACASASPAIWPSSASTRRLLIDRLQRLRGQCIENADFLATLGALFLDDGDPAQALTWLERALLLDPGNLGALADHALALAALGEPAALQELARSWQGRSDLPAALRAKLFPADPRSAYALPITRLGYAARPSWGWQGGVSVSAGYESNLDRSPRLSELTLTFPEGPVVLPVLSAPRSGAASLVSSSLQWAYAPQPAMVLRSSVSLNLRTAPSARSTDWQQAQWNLEAAHTGTGWRAQADASAAWVRGALNEPYRLTRGGLSAEALGADCRARLAFAQEQRRQSISTSLDATATLWVTDFHCPVPGAPAWMVSLSLSQGRDRPELADRPGGPQRLQSNAWRLTGPLGTATRLDFNLRHITVRDSTGYSVLLEDNAVRQLALRQYSVELTHALDGYGWPGLTASLQWQSARQASNLKLFAYRADNVYGGLRFSW